MTEQERQEYAYKIFDDLSIGQSILVEDYARKNPEALIQYGKDYIDNGGGLVFNADYSIMTKTMSYQETAEWIASLNQQSA